MHGRNRTGLTYAEYARHRGCDRSLITRAVKLGKLVLHPDGSVDPIASDKLWEAKTQARIKAVAPKCPITPSEPRDPGEPQDPSGPSSDARDDDYVTQHGRHERIKADRAQIKLDEELGKVVALDPLKATWFAAMRAVRDRLRAVPARVVGLIMACETEHEILQLLQREIDDAILDITDPDRPPMPGRPTQPEDEGLTPPGAAEPEDDEPEDDEPPTPKAKRRAGATHTKEA